MQIKVTRLSKWLKTLKTPDTARLALMRKWRKYDAHTLRVALQSASDSLEHCSETSYEGTRVSNT